MNSDNTITAVDQTANSSQYLSSEENGTFFKKQVEELDYLMDNIYPKIREYILKNDNFDEKVINYQNPKELKEKLNLTLTKESKSLDSVVEGVEKTLKYSVKTSHPRFYNQLYAGSRSVGQMSEFVTAVLNTAVHTYAVAPVLAMMEVECVRATAEAFGFDTEQADGILVPGGTYANMSALIVARHKFFPHIRKSGWKSDDQPVCFSSPQAHYSIKRAAMIAGMGMDSVITPKCTLTGALIPEALDEAITEAKKQGKTPFFVSTTAGTTVMGGYDNFVEIAKITKKHGVWLHIDGCWGGSAIFSQREKYKLLGCENADSVALNFHKGVSVPVQTNILVTNKHKGLLEQANASGAVYLFHKHEAADYDLGDKSLQCGRRSDSLKLWLCWQREGNDGFAKQVEKAIDNARYFRDQVVKRENFYLISEPEAANVCFFYVPKAFKGYKDITEIYDKLNSITPLIYRRMQKAGNMLVNYNPLLDQGLPYFFRIIFIQTSTNPEHSDFVLDEFERLGNDVTDQDIEDYINALK